MAGRNTTSVTLGVSHANLYNTGFSLGTNALAEMLDTEHQGEAMQALRAALMQLPRADTAALGFVDALCKDLHGFGKKPERESQVDNERMQSEVGQMMQDRANAGHIEMLNIGRLHYEVNHLSKTYFLFGSNVFSNWCNEEPATWEANREVLSKYREISPPRLSGDEIDEIPF